MPTDEASFVDAHPLWLAADIGSLILSARPLDAQYLSAIGIYHCPDQPCFGKRETRLAEILLTEVAWLHADGLAGGIRGELHAQTSHGT